MKEEEKVIVDVEALNAPPTADDHDFASWSSEGEEIPITEEDLLSSPKEDVRLPGVPGHERPEPKVGNRPPGVPLPSSATEEEVAETTSMDLENSSEPRPAWWHHAIMLGLLVVVALLLVQQYTNDKSVEATAHRLDNVEQTVASASEASKKAAEATTELSGEVEQIHQAVNQLGEKVDSANQLAEKTADTVERFSHALVGNPADPSGQPGLLVQLLDEVKGARKALGRNRRELKQLRDELKDRDLRFESLNARLDALGQMTQETFSEARAARKAAESRPPVHVKVLVPRTKTVVVDRK